jgi:hypothetical protein
MTHSGSRPTTRHAPRVAAAAVLMAAFTAAPAAAADTFEIDEGLACSEFALGVTVDGGATVTKEFTDRDGNLRVLSAGRGSALTFTNLGSGEELALKPNGAVNTTVMHQDGTATVTMTGHNVLILFPTDAPAGPSTTLHVGRVVFTVGTDGVFTVDSEAGRAIDICAALSD